METYEITVDFISYLEKTENDKVMGDPISQEDEFVWDELASMRSHNIEHLMPKAMAV